MTVPRVYTKGSGEKEVFLALKQSGNQVVLYVTDASGYSIPNGNILFIHEAPLPHDGRLMITLPHNVTEYAGFLRDDRNRVHVE